MKLIKSKRRERLRLKKRYGMKVSISGKELALVLREKLIRKLTK